MRIKLKMAVALFISTFLILEPAVFAARGSSRKSSKKSQGCIKAVSAVSGVPLYYTGSLAQEIMHLYLAKTKGTPQEPKAGEFDTPGKVNSGIAMTSAFHFMVGPIRMSRMIFYGYLSPGVMKEAHRLVEVDMRRASSEEIRAVYDVVWQAARDSRDRKIVALITEWGLTIGEDLSARKNDPISL